MGAKRPGGGPPSAAASAPSTLFFFSLFFSGAGGSRPDASPPRRRGSPRIATVAAVHPLALERGASDKAGGRPTSRRCCRWRPALRRTPRRRRGGAAAWSVSTPPAIRGHALGRRRTGAAARHRAAAKPTGGAAGAPETAERRSGSGAHVVLDARRRHEATAPCDGRCGRAGVAASAGASAQTGGRWGVAPRSRLPTCSDGREDSAPARPRLVEQV